MLGLDIRCEACDTDLVDVMQAHIQVLGDVVVVPLGDKSELVVVVIDGHRIGIEGIVLLADQFQLGPDLELLECLATLPVVTS